MDTSRSERLPLFAHTGEAEGPNIQSSKENVLEESTVSARSESGPIRISEADQAKRLGKNVCR